MLAWTFGYWMSTALAAAIEVASFWIRHAGENRLLKALVAQNRK